MSDFSPYIEACLLWKDSRASAVFKAAPEDFVVNEILDWDFTGAGEHIFLQIEKTNCNTVWVAKQLAKFYGVPPRDIGYSGLKDRHAITTQYFSVRLPGVKVGEYKLPLHDEYRVMSHVLHDKKLKRGNHQYNDFTIRLKAVTGEQEIIEERLKFIRENGCPNLFDGQRFGHENGNLTQLSQWIADEIELRKRNEKSIVLSAMRSAVFNRQLAERVKAATWQQILAGDIAILDGTNSYFSVGGLDDTITQRAAIQDIHPAGVLVGESSVFAESSPELLTLMARERLSEGYRSLRLRVSNLSWKVEGSDWVISMRLPTGAYASGVIRQVFDC